MKTKKTNHIRRGTGRKLDNRRPFVEHLHELRRRLFFCALAVLAWGSAIYSVQMHVVDLLLKPSHGQHFIYTSPIGGIDFLFKICMYGGIVLSLPVIVYNFLRFIEPVLGHSTRSFIAWQSFACALLALGGMIFGYYIGLPAALHFLLHQFTTIQIQPLVTIQSYLSFVIVYMVGSALMFQLPLLLLFINRIKPLKPSRLLHYERWVILCAFVLAGLMNPTPNMLSQLLIAGPFIIMYQVGIVLITLVNRGQSVPKRRVLAQPQPEEELVPILSTAERRLARYVIRRTLRAANRQPMPRRRQMVDVMIAPRLA
ncbi:MAG TPA: twin-arginine translocase subunit TatC [Candidatus Saccharimonadales bacterium]|nr:twin-arginine translocase subunit TatC [Candidatus Saccharimonadales bacterium]